MEDNSGDALQQRLQSNVDMMIGNIEISKLRPLQRKTHLCIADCYGNTSKSQDQIYRCVDECSAAAKISQSIIQREISSFQNRLQRCTQACQDDFDDEITPDLRANTRRVEAAQKKAQNCASRCVDRGLALLKSVQAKIENDIDQLKK